MHLFGEHRLASLRSLLPAYACDLMVAFAFFADSRSFLVGWGSDKVVPSGWASHKVVLSRRGSDKGLGMHLEVDALDLFQGDEIDQSHACFGTCGKLLELLVGAQQENSVRNDSDCVRKKLSARNFRQVSCLKVQSPRVVFVELPEQHIEILLSREQTQIDEGLFHLPLIQYPVDSEIHGADQQSSRPVRQLSAHTSTLHDGQGCMSVQLGIVQLGHSAVSGSFICILTRSCPCRTC